jgi:hypothetical protein
LETYSDEALQHGVLKYNAHPDKKGVRDAVKYICTVAKNYRPHATGRAPFPKTGRMGTFAKKIVHGTMNANHSPSSGANDNNTDDPLLLSLEERVNFAEEQIEYFDAVLNTGDDLLLAERNYVRGGGFRSLSEIMRGMAPGMKDRWKHIKKDPKSMPSLLNGFKINLDEASCFQEDDQDYEEHLQHVSADKTDPEGYKLMVRKSDYRRTARK